MIGLATVVAAVSALLLPPIPGAFNPDVRQATIHQTVCVHGWTRTVRPPQSETDPIKHELLEKQQLPGSVSDYQLDHMVSLSLGGAPRSPRNLWMQPIRQAKRDDRTELHLYEALCAGTITLVEARRLEISFKRIYG